MIALPPDIERRIQYDLNSGCWLWSGLASQRGYGRIKSSAKAYNASHRVIYEILRGPIQRGLVLDHLCRTTLCCNPAHLEPVTSAENTRRGRSGRPQASRTHCPQGHPYDDVNTYRSKSGHRHCLACNAERRTTYWANRAQATNERRRKIYAERKAAGLPVHMGGRTR